MKLSSQKIYLIFSLLILFFCWTVEPSLAQSKRTTTENIPLLANYWNFQPEKVQFLEYNSKPAMKILKDAGAVILKDWVFSNGTIELDIKIENELFGGFFFRYQDENESEYFYFRMQNIENPNKKEAVQYSPIIKGVNIWDLMEYYQGPVKQFNKNDFNHIKIVVSGSQMKLYVNHVRQPTLEIPKLSGNTIHGSIGFDAEATITNLIIKPNATEDILSIAGIDPTYNDPNFIRDWKISKPFDLPKGSDLIENQWSKSDTSWVDIKSEYLGLINITRLYGRSDNRRAVWLKVKLNSNADQKINLDLGFSANDEVWVFLNGQLVYLDKNFFMQPTMKYPVGRCSIENSSFSLPFKNGENELIIGTAQQFYGIYANVDGWGIMARLRNMNGIEFIYY